MQLAEDFPVPQQSGMTGVFLVANGKQTDIWSCQWPGSHRISFLSPHFSKWGSVLSLTEMLKRVGG